MSKKMPRLPLGEVIDMNILQYDLAKDLQHLQGRQSSLYDNIVEIEKHISSMKDKQKNNSDEYMSDIEFEMCQPNYLMLETALQINKYYYTMYTSIIQCILQPDKNTFPNKEV